MLGNDKSARLYDNLKSNIESSPLAVHDAAVIFSDSRVTVRSRSGELHSEDIIQKAYMLSQNVCIAFSGVVYVCKEYIDHIIQLIPSLKDMHPDIIATSISGQITEVLQKNNWANENQLVSFILGVIDMRTRKKFLYKIEANFNSSFSATKIEDIAMIGGSLPRHEIESVFQSKVQEVIDEDIRNSGSSKIRFFSACVSLRIAFEHIINEEIDPFVGGLIQNLVLDGQGIRPEAYAAIPTDSTKTMKTTMSSDAGWVMTEGRDRKIGEAKPLWPTS